MITTAAVIFGTKLVRALGSASSVLLNGTKNPAVPSMAGIEIHNHVTAQQCTAIGKGGRHACLLCFLHQANRCSRQNLPRDIMFSGITGEGFSPRQDSAVFDCVLYAELKALTDFVPKSISTNRFYLFSSLRNSCTYVLLYYG